MNNNQTLDCEEKAMQEERHISFIKTAFNEMVNYTVEQQIEVILFLHTELKERYKHEMESNPKGANFAKDKLDALSNMYREIR
jgi:23S rRNA maturation-related 3'-5' exoribonuclease YhaM